MRLGLEFAACFQGLGDKILNNSGALDPRDWLPGFSAGVRGRSSPTRDCHLLRSRLGRQALSERHSAGYDSNLDNLLIWRWNS
jgi:hypothetical protein